MKIAFLMPTPFDLGGEQRVCSVVSNILVQAGNEVSIICTNKKVQPNYDIYKLDSRVRTIFLNEPKLKYKIMNISCRVLSKINRTTNIWKNNLKVLDFIYLNRDKGLLNELINIINENEFDYVIGLAGRYSLILTYIKDKISAKVIGWQHSSYEAYFHTKGINYWHEEKLYKERIPKLDKYVVLTEYDKINIDNKFNINSVKINNPKSFNSEITSNLESKTFLAAGRFVHVKGFDMLIESFQIFSKKDKNWNLIILGSGPEEKKLRKMIRKYQLEDRIKIYPFTNEIQKYYLNASTYVLSSRFEGFGMVVVEALEMGVPVIAFDIPAVKEILGDSNSGITVEKFDKNKYAEAMLKVAKNEEYRKELGKNAKIRAKDFSFEAIGEKWDAMLKSI